MPFLPPGTAWPRRVSDFEFGDSGRIYFVMRGDDLAGGRWDRARVVFQCY